MAGKGTGATLNQLNRTDNQFLEIIEQPSSHGTRFRYKCEARNAGCLYGKNSRPDSKSFPMVKVHNTGGATVIIVASLVTNEDKPRPHPHRLMGENCDKGVCSVKIKGSPDNNGAQATLSGIGIQCVKKSEVMDSLNERKEINVDPFNTGHFIKPKEHDLKVVRMAFQAFMPDRHGKFTRVLKPVLSEPIYDKKAVADLNILRLSTTAGSVLGGTSIFLFTEKVEKNNIEVWFYEGDDAWNPTWKGLGEFNEQDIHKQVAMVVKSPPYQDPNIQYSLDVKMALFRPKDNEISEPKIFQYMPESADKFGFEAKKRKRIVEPRMVSNQAPEVRNKIKSRLMKKNQPVATISAPVTSAPETGHLPAFDTFGGHAGQEYTNAQTFFDGQSYMPQAPQATAVEGVAQPNQNYEMIPVYQNHADIPQVGATVDITDQALQDGGNILEQAAQQAGMVEGLGENVELQGVDNLSSGTLNYLNNLVGEIKNEEENMSVTLS